MCVSRRSLRIYSLLQRTKKGTITTTIRASVLSIQKRKRKAPKNFTMVVKKEEKFSVSSVMTV